MQHIKTLRKGDQPEPRHAAPGNGCWIVKPADGKIYSHAESFDLFHIAPVSPKPQTERQRAKAKRRDAFKRHCAWDRATRETKDQAQTRMATAYARWLCERDGVKVPTDHRAKISLEMDYLDPDNAPGLTGSQRRRVRAVCWGYSEQVRAGFHRGRSQWVTNAVELLRVEIPNWDHVPAMTETTVQDDPRPFARLPMNLEAAA